MSEFKCPMCEEGKPNERAVVLGRYVVCSECADE